MNTSNEDSTVERNVKNLEDVFRILVATDIHLGYAEDDPVRAPDTFNTLEEIFQIATEEEVDFVLLGGDLFHHAQPSPYCINKCMEIFKRYCLGDRPVRIEFLSDPSVNFTQSMEASVNYEDPNLNVSLPIFSIHGNHDDPTGLKQISALDLLSTSGLVNYFGRCTNLDKIDISPILLRKGTSKLALYGLSHIRDERLGRLFIDNKVKILSPPDQEDWFHLLVWHQNRAARGSKNFIPDHTLPDILNLVIWGHEHDCRIEPEGRVNDVQISQPGSTVATSLAEGESLPKHVGILEVRNTEFRMTPKPLKSVRPFIFREIHLQDSGEDDFDDEKIAPAEYSKQVITEKINSMFEEAKDMDQDRSVADKPLLRLIVRYDHERQVFNSIRFGHLYANKVANPDTMLKFQAMKPRSRAHRKRDDGNHQQEELDGPMLADRVEDLIAQHYAEKENFLSLFPLNSVTEAVKKFVDSNDLNAVSDICDKYIQDVLTHLNETLPEPDAVEQAILDFKNKVEHDGVNFANNVLNDPQRKKNAKKPSNSDEADDVQIIDDDVQIIDDDDDDGFGAITNTSKRGTGRGTRGGTTGRGSRTRATRRKRGKVGD